MEGGRAASQAQRMTRAHRASSTRQRQRQWRRHQRVLSRPPKQRGTPWAGGRSCERLRAPHIAAARGRSTSRTIARPSALAARGSTARSVRQERCASPAKKMASMPCQQRAEQPQHGVLQCLCAQTKERRAQQKPAAAHAVGCPAPLQLASRNCAFICTTTNGCRGCAGDGNGCTRTAKSTRRPSGSSSSTSSDMPWRQLGHPCEADHGHPKQTTQRRRHEL